MGLSSAASSSPASQQAEEVSSSRSPSESTESDVDDDSNSETEGDEDGTETKKRKYAEAREELEEGEEEAANVTALSHAERRRQKRRERQNESQKTRGIDSPKKSATVPAKRQNSIWVGNLSYKTTEEDLKAFFAWAGEITRIHMPTKAAPTRKPENRGFAYIDFSTPEGKAAAIALSEQHLIGRKLLIKDGDDFTGRPGTGALDEGALSRSKTHSKTAQRILRAQKQPPGPTLFFGNLGFETTETDIMEMLNAHRIAPAGKGHRQAGNEMAQEAPNAHTKPWIRKVRMGTFEDSGLCKGFAFVDFVNTDDATSALINPKNFLLNGRKLVVEYASPDAVRRGMPKAKQIDKVKPRRERGGRQEAQSKEEHRPPKRQRVDESLESRPQKRDNQVRKGLKSRTKPGAALASAQRESVAIIPSQGKKIKFD